MDKSNIKLPKIVSFERMPDPYYAATPLVGKRIINQDAIKENLKNESNSESADGEEASS